jgi:hypothetical protein
MKHLLKLAIAGVVFSVMPAGTAAEWTKITENAVKDRFFVDTSSIQRNGSIVWYWEYREFSEANNALLDVNVKEPLYGAVMRWSVDCTSKSQRLRKLNAYTKNRQLIQKFEYGNNGVFLKPKTGSSTFHVMSYVCAQENARDRPASEQKPDKKPEKN